MDHGTVEMYRKELREHRKGTGPEPCDPCREAQAKYMQEYRRTTPARDRSAETRQATIRRRALSRLAQEFPGTYERLLTEETERAPLGRSRVRSLAGTERAGC